MEMRNEMMVYMVAGGMDYEGENLEFSGKVFRNREDAVKYGESLVGSYANGDRLMSWDYYEIKEVELG
jgi:hypothetical protein